MIPITPRRSLTLAFGPMCSALSSFGLHCSLFSITFWFQFLWASASSCAARHALPGSTEGLPLCHSCANSTVNHQKEHVHPASLLHCGSLWIPPLHPFSTWPILCSYLLIFLSHAYPKGCKLCVSGEFVLFAQCWISRAKRRTWHIAGASYYFWAKCSFDHVLWNFGIKPILQEKCHMPSKLVFKNKDFWCLRRDLRTIEYYTIMNTRTPVHQTLCAFKKCFSFYFIKWQ